MGKEIKVVELFAGVGGFRIGLKNASDKYNIVWSNQWEPKTKSQEASDIYIKRFGKEGHSNKDIAQVKIEEIPEHNLLVGGFPCQDYSVARSKNQSQGIEGKKGILWWQIHRILDEAKKKPEFIFLENVDRLLKSPAKQRGRDFAIMLASLCDLGYIVEWRVINAADYGMPQRRRRVFILGYHKNSRIHKKILYSPPSAWITEKGVLSKAFKIEKPEKPALETFDIGGDLVEITKNFGSEKKSPFENCGIAIDRKVSTLNVKPNYSGKRILLKDVLVHEKKVPEEFFVNGDLERWKYFKGAKRETKTNKEGHSYLYSEGAMVFPDALDKPSRTIITGEGGSGPSRFKHIIKTESGRFRRLTPLELERLNMFPDNHTEGASDVKRAFLMGNALVVGVIERIGKALVEEAD